MPPGSLECHNMYWSGSYIKSCSPYQRLRNSWPERRGGAPVASRLDERKITWMPQHPTHRTHPQWREFYYCLYFISFFRQCPPTGPSLCSASHVADLRPELQSRTIFCWSDIFRLEISVFLKIPVFHYYGLLIRNWEYIDF
jgi:hypothetical protein